MEYPAVFSLRREEGTAMGEPGSVSAFLEQLRAGDAAALQPLWERYYARLVGLARQRLQGRAPALADEEDIALSAFDSFQRGAEQGRFPRLNDRDDLWQVLILLARQKAADLLQHEGRQKRGGGRVRPLSALADPQASASEESFLELFGPEPTPALAAELAEDCRRRLDALDGELRAVAVRKMEGYSNEEIAAALGRSVATVERKLRVIRSLWQPDV
jgi:DNA-directed RNA polymerase specialized sigma24 family protein